MAEIRRRRPDEDSPDYADESHTNSGKSHNKDHRLSDAPNLESAENSGGDNHVSCSNKVFVLIKCIENCYQGRT